MPLAVLGALRMVWRVPAVRCVAAGLALALALWAGWAWLSARLQAEGAAKVKAAAAARVETAEARQAVAVEEAKAALATVKVVERVVESERMTLREVTAAQQEIADAKGLDAVLDAYDAAYRRLLAQAPAADSPAADGS